MTESGVTIVFGNKRKNKFTSEKLEDDDVPGLSLYDLLEIKKFVKKEYKCKCDVYDLTQCMKDVEVNVDLAEANVIVIRGLFADILDKANKVFTTDEEVIKRGSIKSVKWDDNAFIRGELKRSSARKFLLFERLGVNEVCKKEMDSTTLKASVYNIDKFPLMEIMSERIEDIVSRIYERDDIELRVEGNFYYDLDKTQLPFHRDRERSLTIACRFGDNFPTLFSYFHENIRISDIHNLTVNAGDVYIMTKHASGYKLGPGALVVKHAAGRTKKAFWG